MVARGGGEIHGDVGLAWRAWRGPQGLGRPISAEQRSSEQSTVTNIDMDEGHRVGKRFD